MKVKSFLHAQIYSSDTKVDYTIFPTDMSDYGYLLVKELEVEIGAPVKRDVLVGKQIESLLKKKKEIEAQAWKDTQAIEEAIQNLQALTYNG